MVANFLHGVETIPVKKGSRVINEVKSALIGIVGTAPIYQLDSDNQFVNEPKLITNEVDAAKYCGSSKTGFTIPQALDAIFDQGSGTVIVVNVFDPSVHKTAVAETSKTFSSDTLDLGKEGITGLTVKSSDGNTTYVADTHYSLDAVTGIITRIAVEMGGIASSATVKVAYSHADITKVTNTDIIGEIDESGNKTGIKALESCYTKYGMKPRILIAPVYHTQESVVDQLAVMADKLKADVLIDAPIGTTFEQAIAGRGPSGTINFNYSNNNVHLCYPHLKVYDEETGLERLEPFSQRFAGVIVATDLEYGYWYSASNKEIKGISGLEFPISFALNDPTCEANLLNEKGIVTAINDYGTGFRTWGNRSSAFPASTDIDTFMSVKRTGVMIDESIEIASMAFVDLPVDQAIIEDIVNAGNRFLAVLKGRGAIINGNCYYNPAKNTSTELAKGHVVISRKFLPPPPLERLTYESEIDINLFNLTGTGVTNNG